MAQGTANNRLYMVIGAVAIVVVVGGIILFSGNSAQTPSTAEQPTTETPATPPAATPPAATPPAATPPAPTVPAPTTPATPPGGETK